MLKRLRIKFIALNMTTIFLVMAVAFVGICFTERQQNLKEVQASLGGAIHKAAEADRNARAQEDPLVQTMPESQENSETSALGQERSDTPSARLAQDGSQAESKRPDGMVLGKGEESYTIPVAVYRLLQDGSLTAAFPDQSVISVDENAIEEAAQTIAQAADGTDVLSDCGLVYMKQSTKDGTYVTFADSSFIERWKSLAASLALAGSIALAALFAINVFFARWALRPVEEAWEKQRRFVADASHELKTPLTVILANVSILEKHPETPLRENMQWLESTREEAVRMQELVSDMLSLAQTESAEAFEPARTNLSNLVSKESLQFESVAFERNVSIEEDVVEGMYVQGNERALEKLVGTLIDNACKYAEERSSVTVRLSRQGKKAVLSVRNLGSPIPQESIEHVFDRFYRADKARTHDESRSFGLGLAIAREIAELHGGTIRVESSAEDGTVFTVMLPLSK